jgi:cysteine desulfurase
MSEPAIYLDHAATTPVRPEVLEAMLPYFGREAFGNPSSSHRFGRAARGGLEQARRQLAEVAGVAAEEVYFTSGGTEADNLAIVGSCLAARKAGHRALAAVAATEHKAVLGGAHAVVALGGEERALPVDPNGQLDIGALTDVLAEGPAVVSVMWVNNETGVVQPVAEIADRCAAAGVAFHTDLVQAFGRLPTLLRGTAVTMATISGHKLGAPKGIGALIVRGSARVSPIIHGGGQQREIRPGTENIAGAVGLALAAVLAAGEQAEEARRLAGLRDELAAALRLAIPDLVIAGEAAPRAPHILNVMVSGVDSGTLLMHLDIAGIAASGGSACTTGAAEPSYVLSAMGVPRELAIGALRLSLGRETTAEEILRAREIIPAVVSRTREVVEVLRG